ncbi:ABC transporter permease [Prauserella rugosa]|uniref:Transport permease protein n=1 Tax=Prauserella rugosa TaxID=43354 RepID=A0A660C862_9PSEU|nr:ABC transporter permease [Prauserella rugosa]KID30317.1 ABC-2 type transporter [Prauserella sp. Am3]KMS74153.1 multidrug ABC transporter permease [Streptomyces regensis]TWH19526.1 ABC-2 type transport system permease protein [Prauserella rugosa]HEV6952480.1 ABC transporter permease [Promicromonospora sp.]
MTTSPFPAGTFTPAPGRGRLGRMLLTHARVETALTLRHGEQILLTLLIPLAMLIGLSLLDILPAGDLAGMERVDWITPRILTLAVLSSAFTGQAIALSFDRRYGVLKRLSATALPRWLLVAGRLVAALVVVALQVLVLGVVAALLGWSPSTAGIAFAVALVVLGTVCFGALGVLLGGALRAEAVLALANIVWFVLLLAGGILMVPSALPDTYAAIVTFLPSGALAEGLHAALVDGTFSGASCAVLACWAAVAAAVAAKTTKLT